jgi:hypothetical protein
VKRKKITSVILSGLLLLGTKYSIDYSAFAANTKKVTSSQQSVSVTLKAPKGWKASTKQELQQAAKMGSAMAGSSASTLFSGVQNIIYNCKSANGSSILVISQPNAVDLSKMQSLLTTAFKSMGLNCKISKRNDKYSNITFSTLSVTASKTVNKMTYSINQEYSFAKYKNKTLMMMVMGLNPSEFQIAKNALKTIKIK